MKSIKLSVTTFAISLFMMGCNSAVEQSPTQPYPAAGPVAETAPYDENEYWAKDNFDLERVGNILERSKSPQEFESYLNDDEGINNLDLNGDGYVDYISVSEYDDRGDGERGLSLFSRFGPDLIQEIATIVFYRDDYNSPGARVLMTGNDQIYGDNYHYESNWVDRSVGIVSTLFGQRDNYYRSPYYYNNYPDGYEAYEVVEPRYYRTRIEQFYPQPVFVYAPAPVYLSKIKIKSPNNGLHLGQIKARLVKPTKVQEDFWKGNKGRPNYAKVGPNGKPAKTAKEVNPGRSDVPGKPGKPEKAQKPNDNPGEGKRPDKGGNKGGDKGQGKGKGKP